MHSTLQQRGRRRRRKAWFVTRPDNLEIKQSLIPGAGLGVFTKRAIPKGRHVLEYQGVFETGPETMEETGHGHHAYCYYWNSRVCLNASCKNTGKHGRYVNDAWKSNKRNNLEWTRLEKDRRVFMTAKRRIAAGSELLISYGPDYWTDRTVMGHTPSA